ncbi:unnamed protein product [Didymodactylos carnosus]|uniref:Uncharacterized protein n=1 Tax=Didymodactylos carnosus TaxID=1234261 RepID=A0A8S2FBQ4_9BILA|nr:unnamed protein product [Didymodactylos carnosus]CAF4217859.1 unnamed protein product [Didymodactylos carnosus]
MINECTTSKDVDVKGFPKKYVAFSGEVSGVCVHAKNNVEHDVSNILVFGEENLLVDLRSLNDHNATPGIGRSADLLHEDDNAKRSTSAENVLIHAALMYDVTRYAVCKDYYFRH